MRALGDDEWMKRKENNRKNNLVISKRWQSLAAPPSARMSQVGGEDEHEPSLSDVETVSIFLVQFSVRVATRARRSRGCFSMHRGSGTPEREVF